MTTPSHLKQLIANYYQISGLMAGAVVELVTCDNDEQCETHARNVSEIAAGVNVALDDLRRFVADPKVLGRDNFYTYLEANDEDLTPPPDAA